MNQNWHLFVRRAARSLFHSCSNYGQAEQLAFDFGRMAHSESNGFTQRVLDLLASELHQLHDEAVK